jgi:hypothetical protein
MNQLSSNLYRFFEDSNKATGNTICDILLNGHCYDYKFDVDNKIPLARNIIMSVQSYNNNAFVKFISEWQNHLIFIERTQINDLSKNAIDYYKDLYLRVKALDENKSLTPVEKVQSLNIKIFTDLDHRPKECFVPLMIPVGKDSPTPITEGIIEKIKHPPIKDTRHHVIDTGYHAYIRSLDSYHRNLLLSRTGGLFGSSLEEFDDNTHV